MVSEAFKRWEFPRWGREDVPWLNIKALLKSDLLICVQRDWGRNSHMYKYVIVVNILVIHLKGIKFHWIQYYKGRNFWHMGIDFMRPFSPFYNKNYIPIVVDYVSKWIEENVTHMNDTFQLRSWSFSLQLFCVISLLFYLSLIFEQ